MRGLKWGPGARRLAVAAAGLTIVAGAFVGGAIAGGASLIEPITGSVYSDADLKDAASAARDEGYDDGEAKGFEDGLAEGDAAGYDRGVTAGEARGFDAGWADGYEQGTADTLGTAEGIVTSAYSEGYGDGYSDGCLSVFSALGTTKVMDYYDYAFESGFISTLTGTAC